MRRLGSLVPILICFAATIARADFSGDVSRALRQAPSKASIAVRVVALDESASPRVLYDRDGSRPMIPASNLKLLTTAAALDALGSDFKFQTKLYVRLGETAGEAELAVIGGGDPGFGDAELLRDIDGWGTTTVFENWARLLQNAGITTITKLTLDDGIFDAEYDHPNWPENQKHRWYEAQVGGLNLNINCVDVYLTRGGGSRMNYRLDPPTQYVTVDNSCRVGRDNAVQLGRHLGTNEIILGGTTDAEEQGPMNITVHGPTGFFGTVLAETLERNGLTVGEMAHDPTLRNDLEGWRLAAVHETPMSTVLARTNKDSINLYAECLVKRISAKDGVPGSWAGGNEAVKAYVARAVDPGVGAAVHLDDGSGMSRDNRVTAEAMTGVLAAQFASDTFETFRASLSEAGEDGTLESRFRSSDRSDLRGRVFGKTGYINNVSTMSGYLHGRDGRWYAFSVLVNDCPSGEIWKAKRLQEDVVLALDNSLPTTTPAPTPAAQ